MEESPLGYFIAEQDIYLALTAGVVAALAGEFLAANILSGFGFGVLAVAGFVVLFGELGHMEASDE